MLIILCSLMDDDADEPPTKNSFTNSVGAATACIKTLPSGD